MWAPEETQRTADTVGHRRRRRGSRVHFTSRWLDRVAVRRKGRGWTVMYLRKWYYGCSAGAMVGCGQFRAAVLVRSINGGSLQGVGRDATSISLKASTIQRALVLLAWRPDLMT